jgi:hypothetical protein
MPLSLSLSAVHDMLENTRNRVAKRRVFVIRNHGTFLSKLHGCSSDTGSELQFVVSGFGV